jgi:hypothetical protein
LLSWHPTRYSIEGIMDTQRSAIRFRFRLCRDYDIPRQRPVRHQYR